jgi:ABC-2 type transport system permease protein
MRVPTGALTAGSRLPFWHQVTMMTWRNVRSVLRSPAELIPAILISVFFLLVYNSSFENAAAELIALAGVSYISFVIPVSVVSSALSGSGIAGQSLVQDIESGYFDKLLLTPISRAALLLAPIFAGAIVLVIQTVIVLAVGLLLGLSSATGLIGYVFVIFLSLMVGLGFSGLIIGVALRTGNAAATQSASFLFFPLTFLAPTQVPLEYLSGWLRTAAELNPITYVLEAMRAALITGWEGEVIVRALLACAVLFVVPYMFALTSLTARTRRK